VLQRLMQQVQQPYCDDTLSVDGSGNSALTGEVKV
jgi:hypothetical protein